MSHYFRILIPHTTHVGDGVGSDPNGIKLRGKWTLAFFEILILSLF